MASHSAAFGYLHGIRALIVAQTLACQARIESSAIEQRFDSLSRTDQAVSQLIDRERAAAIGAAYDQAFTLEYKNNKLPRIKDRDLDLLYRAAHLAAFHTLDQRHIEHMTLTLDELQRRGLARPRHYVQAYEILIKARMLDEAIRLTQQRSMPEIEPLPELREGPNIVAGHPTELVIHPNKRELLRRSVNLDNVRIIVISHPLCHFSSTAMSEIERDPILQRAFGVHAKWLAPQYGRINFDAIQKWNREHPGQEITLTYRREEWPMIDRWSTPAFYFLKHGVVRAKVQGWPKGGRREELLTALRQVE